MDTDRTAWLERVTAEAQAAVRQMELDLRGLTVLTEAATGPFVVTAAIAGAAGASRVLAVAKSTRHGAAQVAMLQVAELAAAMQVPPDRIEFAEGRPDAWLSQADVITNSGHVRPLDAHAVALMKPTAAISLMYEGWEWRPEDVDLDACRKRGVVVAGVSERHPCVNVFSYLGPAAVELARASGILMAKRRVLLVCDNPFLPHLNETLSDLGASVVLLPSLKGGADLPASDVVLLALKPRAEWAVGQAEAAVLARQLPGVPLVQFWGDVDRQATNAVGVRCAPSHDPGRGRMGILLSDLGPEPAIRLQTGGLKVGEILARARHQSPGLEGVDAALQAVIQSGYGMLPEE